MSRVFYPFRIAFPLLFAVDVLVYGWCRIFSVSIPPPEINGFFLISSLFAAPIFEELLFRGPLVWSLANRSRNFSLVVLFVSAAIFGLAHLNLATFVPLFFVGLACGCAAWLYRGLSAPILLHFLFNLQSALVLLYGK